MSWYVRWKLNDPDRAVNLRSVESLGAMASALAEAFNEHTEDIEVSCQPMEKSWIIVWANGRTSGHCSLKGDDLHLKTAIDELLKTHPAEVSIAERKPPAPLPAPPIFPIAQALVEGDVVPFLGAGVSATARRPPDATWNDSSQFPPTGAELSEFLAGKIRFPSSTFRERADLARVASFYSSVSRRNSLRDLLRTLFYRYSIPALVHEELARISKPMLIVTTNYDALMEDALRSAGTEFDVVVHCTDSANKGNVLYWEYGAADPNPRYVKANMLKMDLAKRTIVYKMHGSVDRFNRLIEQVRPQTESLASFVITEEDYIDFLSRMNSVDTVIPAVLMEYLKAKSFLFLGYGLRDWNFRVVLQNLSGALPTMDAAEANRRRLSQDFLGIEEDDRPHWAIQKDPSEADIRLWQKRNVMIANSDLDIFITDLSQELENVRQLYALQ